MWFGSQPRCSGWSCGSSNAPPLDLVGVEVREKVFWFSAALVGRAEDSLGVVSEEAAISRSLLVLSVSLLLCASASAIRRGSALSSAGESS